jgi:hypothetical protein
LEIESKTEIITNDATFTKKRNSTNRAKTGPKCTREWKAQPEELVTYPV